MTRASAARIAQSTGRTQQESIEAFASWLPSGVCSIPARWLSAVIWLASPTTDAINGQTIVLDGGGIQT